MNLDFNEHFRLPKNIRKGFIIFCTYKESIFCHDCLLKVNCITSEAFKKDIVEYFIFLNDYF